MAVGDQFRLSYTVNTQDVRDFRVPSIKDFEVLMGPSRSYSMQSINGKRSENLTFTYILMANKEGTFTIPGASITAGGNQMISNSVKVKVLPADQQSSSGNQSRGGRSGQASSGSSVSRMI